MGNSAGAKPTEPVQKYPVASPAPSAAAVFAPSIRVYPCSAVVKFSPHSFPSAIAPALCQPDETGAGSSRPISTGKNSRPPPVDQPAFHSFHTDFFATERTELGTEHTERAKRFCSVASVSGLRALCGSCLGVSPSHPNFPHFPCRIFRVRGDNLSTATASLASPTPLAPPP
jgi:hypothetical protein